jgi:hypothetical protein
MIRTVLATLALALSPALAAAQETPAAAGLPDAPGAMAAPDPARLEAMRAAREQVASMHKQARLQMLAALTPQHRAQLATVIGQFAVSANPDPAALAKTIDAMLSRNEAQGVVDIAASERVNERGVMEAVRSQMEASLTPDQRTAMAAREEKMAARRAEHVAPAPDPGRELARELASAALGWGGRGERGSGPVGDLEGPPGPPR